MVGEKFFVFVCSVCLGMSLGGFLSIGVDKSRVGMLTDHIKDF